jgi:bifunctional lysine-specific demethylase and histidyl-hydroxylase MINA
VNFAGAKAVVEEVLQPMPADVFLEAVGRNVVFAKGAPDHPRSSLFGSDPREVILSAYASHAKNLDCHGPASKTAPPAIEDVADAAAFHSVIRDLHEQDFTVRVPDVVPLAPALQRFARALEIILNQPVSASVFWSKAGARAMVHYDRRDNLVVQLSGKKRWFVSTDLPGLQNDWPQIGEPQPTLKQHQVLDMAPGDLLFIPRGVPHTVESTTESVHLAILFTPPTLRDALIAAIDQMSDLERSFREPVARRAGDLDAGLAPLAAEAFARLIAQCRSPGFIEEAMEHRAARFIGNLPALPKTDPCSELTPETEVEHTPCQELAHDDRL